ncbi:hypothetical protein [Flavobacterium subsaxonicum]|uniref:Uncharacterized protein n=1 Tax=Flavobacterium subsaxonicum WB 4.1-42 = DSM 21790 TaxID=1121898 RepID=A0A0A2N1G0_9FLAO|nr:hypothetical protein [Flavobacterium subsaxonicum]KGO94295.1 hypothetical protein Q766_05080 [Flavobacterium subsaxonicum WB 4.1-42 = DSM 21790]
MTEIFTLLYSNLSSEDKIKDLIEIDYNQDYDKVIGFQIHIQSAVQNLFPQQIESQQTLVYKKSVGKLIVKPNLIKNYLDSIR